ncbi:hypothetical protein ACFWAZ_39310 [Streptomyces collinus]|uniref:hypothetical protein n=1 Tax=Streptomyces collinus TaxID=42684 RepID=UPI00364DDEBC
MENGQKYVNGASADTVDMGRRCMYGQDPSLILLISTRLRTGTPAFDPTPTAGPEAVKQSLIEQLAEVTVSVGREALPEFLGGLVAMMLFTLVTGYLKRRRNRLRTYTFLNSVHPDGSPVRLTTTRGPGTIVRRDVGRGPERFLLTAVETPDGTYAAEPLDR